LAVKTELTLAICSHNPRSQYFGRVLNSIRDQSVPKELWDFILVDNCSEVPLADVWDLSWHPRGRHVFAGELGLAAARRCAIEASSSELLVFVDDDNVLDINYLQEAIKIRDNFPFLGVWGSGAITPEFEIPPDKSIETLLPYLALRTTDVAKWCNFLPCPEATPWGAGLCVRSKVARTYLDLRDRAVAISDRQGKTLLSGGDVEISYVANHLGYGTGVFPELRLLHLIPKERLSRSYLLKVCEGTAISNRLLAYKWEGREPVRTSKIRYWSSFLKNLLLLHGIERQVYLADQRAATIATDIITSTKQAS